MPFVYKDGLPLCSRSGIYAIVNVRNGRVYVGSALAIRGRLHAHRSCLRRGKHDNAYLQNAWNKYGEEAFQFKILETCEPGNVIVREQYWMDSLDVMNRNKGYNLNPVAGGGGMEGRKHSPETCKKMSERMKGKDISHLTEAAAKANKGKSRPQDVKDKIAEAHKGKKKSEAHVEAIKKAHWSKGPNAKETSAKMRKALTGRKLSTLHRMKIAFGGRGKRHNRSKSW